MVGYVTWGSRTVMVCWILVYKTTLRLYESNPSPLGRLVPFAPETRISIGNTSIWDCTCTIFFSLLIVWWSIRISCALTIHTCTYWPIMSLVCLTCVYCSRGCSTQARDRVVTYVCALCPANCVRVVWGSVCEHLRTIYAMWLNHTYVMLATWHYLITL